MRIEKSVTFDEVRAAFENQKDFGTNDWAREVIRLANEEFGHWALAALDLDDILGVMLPRHTHKCPIDEQLIPQCCSTVAKAIEELKSIPPDAPCRQTIDKISVDTLVPVFLSMRPISSSNNHAKDYRAVVDRGYKGLTHLDGLHRLVAWGRAGISGITAYVAGYEGTTETKATDPASKSLS